MALCGLEVLCDLAVLLNGDQVVDHGDLVEDHHYDDQVEDHLCNPQKNLLEAWNHAFPYVKAAHHVELLPVLVVGEPCACQGVLEGNHTWLFLTEVDSVLWGRC